MTPRYLLVALCAAWASLALPAAAAANTAAPAVVVKSTATAPVPLAPVTMSYTFRDTPIEELFNMIARSARINIVLGKGVGGNVSINLYDMTVREAIEAIAEAGGYAVTERAGGFLISDPKTGLPERSAILQVKAMKVRYADVTKVGAILARQIGVPGTVTVLDQTKTLVVEATAAGLERAALVLREIDRAPQQILIEAKILEITLDQNENFGVDWSRVFSGDGPDTVGTTGFATRAGPRFFLNLVNGNIEAYLSALSNKGRVHTLATPRLLALEDQEASTNVGDQLGYRLTTTINNVTSESIEFLDTGVILRVTPSVDADGRIMMKIRPEVSSGSVSAGIPVEEDHRSEHAAGGQRRATGADRRPDQAQPHLPAPGHPAVVGYSGDWRRLRQHRRRWRSHRDDCRHHAAHRAGERPGHRWRHRTHAATGRADHAHAWRRARPQARYARPLGPNYTCMFMMS